MKKLYLLFIITTLCLLSFGQIPQGFYYQAVVRNTDGTPIASQSVSLKISLQDESGKTIYYQETHSKETNDLGVINITIGEGNVVTGTFTDVPWNTGNIYMGIEVNTGSGYSSMGSPVQFLSVPYALYAENGKEIVSDVNATDEEPIFVVKNKDGKIVFAVYQAGVRVYVDDSSVKGDRKSVV